MSDRQRWDLCQAKPKSSGGQGEVWWHKVGSCYLNDKGQIVMFLDSLPLPNADGVVQVMGFVPRPREDGAGRGVPATRSAAPARAAGDGARGRGRASAAEDDDEIPFAPEWR